MEKTFEEIDRWVASELQQSGVPGGIIVCVRDSSGILFHEAWGKQNVQTGKDLNKNALFPVGSQSKAVTAAAALALVDDKVLDLDDRLVDFFPYLDHPELSKVNLRGLLSQSTPLQWKDGISLDWDLGRKPYPTKEFIHSPDFKSLIELKDPAYSNLGYLLIGQMIEDKTGMSYDQAVSRRLLKREDYKITDIHPSVAGINVEARATVPVGYYDTREEVNIPAPVPNLGICTPSGGIYATAPDMTNFFQLLLDGKILSPRFTAEMRQGTEKIASIAGIYATPTPTGTMYGKKGGLTGYYSWTTYHESGFTTSVMSSWLEFKDEKNPKRLIVDKCMHHVVDTFASGPGLSPQPVPAGSPHGRRSQRDCSPGG